MKIDKDTKLYASFARTAGSKGCEFFNAAFEKYGINAIYKSFSVLDINEAFQAVKILDIKGFAVAMPFKKIITSNEKIFNSSNTSVINTVVKKYHHYSPVDRRLIATHTKDYQYVGYNTDYNGVKQILEETPNYFNFERIYILGTGGLSTSVQHAVRDLGGDHKLIIINRNGWELLKDLSNCLIYNCTPEDVTFLAKNNTFIDCRVGTPDGDKLYDIQAKIQFKLYTGIDYE